MIQTENFYWFGVSAAVYLTTCWMFAAVRWFHTCREPKDRHDYLYPDRKLLIVIYLLGTVLLPYLLDPTSPSAWTLWKSYFPGTYYFYSGSLFFCFFGTVRQWNQWKTVIWIAAVFTMAAMLPLVLDAWIPDGLLTANASNVWGIVVTVVGIVMMGYAAMA